MFILPNYITLSVLNDNLQNCCLYSLMSWGPTVFLLLVLKAFITPLDDLTYKAYISSTWPCLMTHLHSMLIIDFCSDNGDGSTLKLNTECVPSTSSLPASPILP